MKRLLVMCMLLCYTVSAFAAVPWQPARAMHDDGAAAVMGEHHDCDEGGAAAVAVAPAAGSHDESCPDCARGFSPCCTGMFALTNASVLLAPPGAVADRTPHITRLHPAGRSESIYRPPRA